MAEAARDGISVDGQPVTTGAMASGSSTANREIDATA